MKEWVEDFIYDIISFFKDFDLWLDAIIYYDGKSYSDPYIGPDEDAETVHKGFRDFDDVYVRDDEDPEDHLLSAATFEIKIPGTSELITMTFEGPMYDLMSFDEYWTKLEDLSDKVRQMVLQEDQTCRKEIEEYLSEELCYFSGRPSDRPDSYHDPIEFDTYEEYEEEEMDAQDCLEREIMHEFGPSYGYIRYKYNQILEKYGLR